MLPNGLGKFFQLVLLEGLAGVGGGLANLVDGDELEGAAVLHWVLSLSGLKAEGCGADTRGLSESPLRWAGELGLAAYVLLRVECLGIALGAEVAVPDLGKGNVLDVELAAGDVA